MIRADGVTRWEYKLIHLNLAPPAGAAAQNPPVTPPPRAAEPAPAPAQQGAPFSKAYLEQEFPGFYSHQASAEQAGRPTNPVLQLQGFLNTQGDDGWCLLGFYNVGPMLLMTFRRRRPGPAEPIESAPELSEPVAADPNLLHQILDRLNRLEQGQPAAPATTASAESVQIISAQQLQTLPAGDPVTTAEASRRLGFRSSVSLTAFLRRHRYPPGLVKRGHSGLAAVYQGIGPVPGKRDQHRWILVDGHVLDQAPSKTD